MTTRKVSFMLSFCYYYAHSYRRNSHFSDWFSLPLMQFEVRLMSRMQNNARQRNHHSRLLSVQHCASISFSLIEAWLIWAAIVLIIFFCMVMQKFSSLLWANRDSQLQRIFNLTSRSPVGQSVTRRCACHTMSSITLSTTILFSCLRL